MKRTLVKSSNEITVESESGSFYLEVKANLKKIVESTNQYKIAIKNYFNNWFKKLTNKS
ncbi:hypothetical protein EDF67_1011099 [Sphingobacterium sp. JUb78]|nr:hypothetical protein [Sphingobacterium kitahiroshimense]TCR14992.1 hypothetical protein EDF67_1011099 [Sphingobacterium sp. JUb78]